MFRPKANTCCLVAILFMSSCTKSYVEDQQSEGSNGSFSQTELFNEKQDSVLKDAPNPLLDSSEITDKDIEGLGVKRENLNISDPLLEVGVIERDVEELNASEQMLYVDATTNMSIAQMQKLQTLREFPRVLDVYGDAIEPYKLSEKCSEELGKSICINLVQHAKSNRVVFDGQNWVVGYQPTSVGKEVVKLK